MQEAKKVVRTFERDRLRRGCDESASASHDISIKEVSISLSPTNEGSGGALEELIREADVVVR